MTATATGLMDRAQLALVDLKQTTAPVTPDQWSCFDQTVYRLLHELVEARTGWLLADPVVLRLRRAYCHYPRPLQPADARVDFSIKETARFLGTSDKVIRKRISDGVMLAAPTDAGYRIPRSELSLGQPPVPSPTSDNHPLARMACILGALTDLLAINRIEPSLPELRAESAAWIGREALALTEVAARSVLSTCEPDTADRPLTIARYAARTSTEILASRPPQGLQDPQVPQPQHRATTHPSLLANSIHQWTRAARHELREQVPRVAVLKDINRQGVHINAALDATLSRLGPDGND